MSTAQKTGILFLTYAVVAALFLLTGTRHGSHAAGMKSRLDAIPAEFGAWKGTDLDHARARRGCWTGWDSQWASSWRPISVMVYILRGGPRPSCS